MAQRRDCTTTDHVDLVARVLVIRTDYKLRMSKLWHRLVRRWIGLYPPMLFAGIRVRRLGTGPLRYRTELRRRWWNANAVGTHFGGALFTMADPFHMLILIEALGRDFVVWDQESRIEFLVAARKPVHAILEISPEDIERIRHEASSETIHPEFIVPIVDQNDRLIARVTKTLYVRKKRRVTDKAD